MPAPVPRKIFRKAVDIFKKFGTIKEASLLQAGEGVGNNENKY